MLQISTRNAEDYQKVKKTLIENPWLLFDDFEEGQEIDEDAKKKLEEDFVSYEKIAETEGGTFAIPCDYPDVDNYEEGYYKVSDNITFAARKEHLKKNISKVFETLEELSGCPIAVKMDSYGKYSEENTRFQKEFFTTEGCCESVGWPMDCDGVFDVDNIPFLTDCPWHNDWLPEGEGEYEAGDCAYPKGIKITEKKSGKFVSSANIFSIGYDDDEDEYTIDIENDLSFDLECLKDYFEITDKTTLEDFTLYRGELKPEEKFIFEDKKNALVVVFGDTDIHPWDEIASGDFDKITYSCEKIVVTLNNEKVVLYKDSSFIIAKILSDTEFNIDDFVKSELYSALLKEMASKPIDFKDSSEVKIATMNNENYKKASKIVAVDKEVKAKAEKVAAKAKKEDEKAAYDEYFSNSANKIDLEEGVTTIEESSNEIGIDPSILHLVKEALDTGIIDIGDLRSLGAKEIEGFSYIKETKKTDPFYIAKYPVTQELYESVMEKNPSKFKGAKRPVENVNLFEAILFCNMLSEKEGLRPCFSFDFENDKIYIDLEADGYRLPTHKEWKVAAKGFSDFEYAGSDNLDEVAWFKENSNGETHNVGEKKPNEFGLYDMCGNVWEFCWEFDKKEDCTRVLICGGSWKSKDNFCLLSNHAWKDVCTVSDTIGFRLVRSSSN